MGQEVAGESTEDDERFERPREATTDENVEIFTDWSCMTGGETCEI